ncbi:MAG TPA: N-methyl-D-aspartate receptor NMDAR2C subunit, partial [Ramlibacter sp.]|nr:N-methyl-D-aspartate receptor NMDAR2C subunit [Ramlibacter sp.]
MSVTLAGWQRMWEELGAQGSQQALFNQLIAAYSERHRHYHTLQHLRECLQSFEAARTRAQRPAEVELALWFHDAVYDVHRDDNEERSAEWAAMAVRNAGLQDAVAQRVHALVIATKHKALPVDPDAQVLVDVDLAILGAAQERFDESDMQIRREFAHVPEAEFRTGRCAVLRCFLERPRLYTTEAFHQALEERA